MRAPRRQTLARLAAVAAAAAAVAGCGSNDGTENASASGDKTPTQEGVVADAEANVARAMKGLHRPGPTEGPKAIRGKKVWALVCASSAPGCVTPAQEMQKAGELLDWDVTIADGKLDPNVYNQQVRAAVSAKADALVLVSVDCAPVEGSLDAAKEAGIAIYGVYAMDCDEKYVGGEPLFDAEISYGDMGSFEDWAADEAGRLVADYMIADSKGTAKVIGFYSTDTASVRHFNDGFETRMKDCGGCTVWPTEFTGQDLISNKLEAKATAALSQHPDADYVKGPYDAGILLGIGPAVEAARAQGREIKLTGWEGLAANVELIKAGTQQLAVGMSPRWAAWAAIDGLNRHFAGEPQVDAGIGAQIVDQDHLPTKTPYFDGPEDRDYEGAYKRIWGVG